MARTVLTISSAKVKFGAVPEGEIDHSALTDYSCQVSEARITASPNTADVPATFCEPASTINVPSSFTLEINGLQDWGVDGSFSEYLFIHDAEQVAFAVFLDGEENPAATGIVSVAAGDFGGPAGETLVLTGSFPILGYPTITNSDGDSLRAITATGATAGTPGTWTPSGATILPADAAAADTAAIVATPSSAWTTGQYVQGSTAGAGGQMHWDGDDWVSGTAP